jgi:hypothetical protein
VSTENPKLALIRNLLAKAEDPAATPAEAEAFTAKAAELMAKYGIEEALLNEGTHADRPDGQVIVITAPFARDKLAMLGRVAQALRCKVISVKHWVNGGYQFKAHLFGFGVDRERVELLYTSLLVQSAYEVAGLYIPYYENKAAYRRSWYDGYSLAIYHRLHAAEKRAAQAAEAQRQSTATPGRGTDLVLASRDSLVAKVMADAFPEAKKGQARILSGSGERDGYSAGRRANLGDTAVTGRDHRAVSR